MSSNIPITLSGGVSTTSETSSPCNEQRPHGFVLAKQSSFDHDPELHLSSSQVKQRLKAHLLNRRRSSGPSAGRLRGCLTDWSTSLELAGTNRRDTRAPNHWWSKWHSADSAGGYDLDVGIPEDKEVTPSIDDATGRSFRPLPQRQSSEQAPSRNLLHLLDAAVAVDHESNMLVDAGCHPHKHYPSAPAADHGQAPSSVATALTGGVQQRPVEAMDVQIATALALVNVLSRLTSPVTSTGAGQSPPSGGTSTMPTELRKSVSESYLLEFQSNPQLVGRRVTDCANPLIQPANPETDRLRLQSHPSAVRDAVWGDAMDWEADGKPNTPKVMPKPVSLAQQMTQIPQRWRKFIDLWENLPIDDWSWDGQEAIERVQGRQESLVPLATAVAFDRGMLDHHCLCSGFTDVGLHPECPNRLTDLLANLVSARLQLPANLCLSPPQLLQLLSVGVEAECLLRLDQSARAKLDQLIRSPVGLEPLRLVLQQLPLLSFCRLLRGRMATEEELCVFHSPEHIASFGCLSAAAGEAERLDTSSTLRCRGDLVVGSGEPCASRRLSKLACGGLGVDSDTVWNPATTGAAARLAVGQVLCLANKVATGELRNGFAIVRPPGHHAEPGHAMGFCYFNSVAVAALNLLRRGLASRVLILDWDIHHGNGTNLATVQHPGLLYISLHRHDNGTFFPGTGGTNDGATAAVFAPTANSAIGSLPHSPGARSKVINIAWQTEAPAGFHGDESEQCGQTPTAERRRHWLEHCTRVQRERQDAGNSASSSVSSVWASRTSSAGLDGSSGDPARGWSSASLASSSSGLGSSIASSLGLPPDSRQLCQQSPTSKWSPSSFVPHGDAEYLAAMWSVVLPVAREFQPEIILISAGFDAAPGHDVALGGYSVSPGMFAWMTRQCMLLTEGRVVLALEGGYAPGTLDKCVTACLNALLLPLPPSSGQTPRLAEHLLDSWATANDWIPAEELQRPACLEAVASLMSCARQQLANGWACLSDITEDCLRRSFVEAAELERRRLVLSAAQSSIDPTPITCSSPLIDDLAKLCMSQPP